MIVAYTDNDKLPGYEADDKQALLVEIVSSRTEDAIAHGDDAQGLPGINRVCWVDDEGNEYDLLPGELLSFVIACEDAFGAVVSDGREDWDSACFNNKQYYANLGVSHG